MPIDENRILSVSAVSVMAKTLLEVTPALNSMFVRGEISNYKITGGHLYFSLKDDESAIPAVMFRSYFQKLDFRPADGMKIIARASATIYAATGRFQLMVSDMQPDGIGGLAAQFEEIKRRLGTEGLFDERIKKPLPKIPSVVGVITSPTGAAVRDIINVTGRRFPYAKIVLFPSLVQGSGAEDDLIEGIRWFGDGKADVVIIGRGGGSVEDLWCFNSEKLAREIRKSRVPVISAVGHETDFTICDFASDRRAATPSVAAELAVPDVNELLKKFDNVEAKLEKQLTAKIKYLRSDLEGIKRSQMLKNPMRYIDEKRLILMETGMALEKEMDLFIFAKRNAFAGKAALLNALSPLKIISKGYTAVTDGNGTLVRSVNDVKSGESINLRLSDGRITASVEERIFNDRK